MLYDQQLKSPLQRVQGLTPSKQHQGLRPDRNGRCCRGCPRHWKFMSQFVLSACFTCLKQQLQTISQSQTNAHKKPEEVGVPGLFQREKQRLGEQVGFAQSQQTPAKPTAPGHLSPFMQATQQLLPPRSPEGKSQLLTPTLMQKAN